jgi:hypothetical protein
MSEHAMQCHGAFSWCELITTDAHAAKQFYTELLGWTTQDVPVEGMTYTLLKAQGSDVGGLMAMPPQAAGMPPYWGTYVTVDDVDTTARKAQDLGATTLVPPTDIPDVGRFYTFRDPQGAVLSVITYLQKAESV